MAFTKKKIDLTFRLGTGPFGETGYNTVTVSGLRVQVRIDEWGGDSYGQAQVRVYGLTQSLMNQLSALTTGEMQLRRNTIQINAGDAESGMPIAFEGQITVGQIDMADAPNVALNLTALAGYLEAIKPAEPTSYQGRAAVVDIMQSLAHRMGYGFESNGVDVQLSTPYYPGTLREQVRRCAEHAHIRWIISKGTLAIWPWGKSRYLNGSIPLISPENGLIGYPTYSAFGIGVGATMLYNPTVNFGQTIEIKSGRIDVTGARSGGLKVADGKWSVVAVSHDLESEVPNGVWFSRIQAIPLVAAG
jgi:hypothetical protein